MFFIINNLFIIKSSLLLLSENFGHCQSFGDNQDLISSFLSAVNSISPLISGSSIKTIDFDEFTLNFYKEPNDSDILIVAITDLRDNAKEMNYKLSKIASSFFEKYKHILENFNGEITQFKGFGQFLIEKKLVEKNCGERSECKGCINCSRTSRLLKTFDVDKNRFLKHLKKSS